MFIESFAIYRYVGYHQEMKRTFFLPIISSIVMGAICFGVYHLFRLFLPLPVSCIIAILVGAIVYFVFVILLKGVGEEELRRLPKGYLLIKLAKKVHLLR